ncbi:hypothetical protein DXG03_007978 [Asterophora parasitica]|uniref:Uncharacterized protein n=1 Tax=Asterophora parasitica TaxID=117018 RepID=A0A9P7G6C5_9AGAR|nr:hypothetical protein DXG03_007978 [Asterophora parasitica]
MTTPDDLPWPELGNVSRGATRGNQGQKGVLGPPDRDGRCILQLRVQPGVLAVRLNRLASDWYRTLDTEVNRALKLTKTYWRKARRRQDYDARADQDHMELHEWLQQLKDKTMSHLELLMQKGDIQGPPYVMADDIELTFLRKFIERQASGVPHNPRLRNSPGDHIYPPRDHSTGDSLTPEPSDSSFADQNQRSVHDRLSDSSSQRNSQSPSLRTTETLSHEASSSKQGLQAARNALSRAQKDTQDAFMRIKIKTFVVFSRGTKKSIKISHRDAFSHPRVTAKIDWNSDVQTVYGNDSTAHLEDSRSRKHLRTWDQGGQMSGL